MVATLSGHPRDPSCNIVHSASSSGQISQRRRVGHRSRHPVALVNGDNDRILIVVIVMLQIVTGLVSALLSISRLTLTGQKLLLLIE